MLACAGVDGQYNRNMPELKPVRRAKGPVAKTPIAKPVSKPKPKRLAASPGARTAPRARKTAANSPEIMREIFHRFAKANPEPMGELKHINVYTLLVAVVLSAQATDAGVNKATGPLFALADTPQKMVALGEERLRDHIRTIGLYRAKAKNVIALSRQLIRDHGGETPASRDLLQQLPGVGRKTANVVMNIAFGEPTIAVDTHIFRVANRIPLAKGKTPLEVELGLEKRIPPEFKQHAHHWLILHGRYVCKARRPECHRCLIVDLCMSADKIGV